MFDTWSREATLLARTLGWATRVILLAPRGVVLVGLVTAGLSLAVTFLWLGFKTSRLDLLNPQSEYNQRWLAFLDEFGSDDDAVVVVEGTDSATVAAAIDRLSATMEHEPNYFHTVLARIDVRPLRQKALHYLSNAQLRELARAIAELQPAISGNWTFLELTNQWKQYNDALTTWQAGNSSGQPLQAQHACRQLSGLVEGLAGALEDPATSSPSVPVSNPNQPADWPPGLPA